MKEIDTMMTHAKKKRAELTKAREFFRHSSRDRRSNRSSPEKMKKLYEKYPCAKCGSKLHWKKDCPQNKINETHEVDEVELAGLEEFVLLGTYAVIRDKAALYILVDTACARSVCGKKWY